jgi:hypothetical protein
MTWIAFGRVQNAFRMTWIAFERVQNTIEMTWIAFGRVQNAFRMTRIAFGGVARSSRANFDEISFSWRHGVQLRASFHPALSGTQYGASAGAVQR